MFQLRFNSFDCNSGLNHFDVNPLKSDPKKQSEDLTKALLIIRFVQLKSKHVTLQTRLKLVAIFCK